MLFELLTTASALAVMGTATYYKTNYNNDADKILKIADNCGLHKKDDRLRLYRRTYNKQGNYTEYVFKIPLGLELKDFTERFGKFKDGINNKSVHRLALADFKGLRFNRNIVKQLHGILNKRVKLNKELEFEYDGMLLVRVYEQGLQTYYQLTNAVIDGCKGWQVALGVTLNGLIRHDFESGPHVLIGGATDMGKSNLLNVIITTLLANNPDDVEFTLIDLKGGLEFGVYERLRQVKYFATNVTEALDALLTVQGDMNTVFNQLRHSGKKDVKQAGITKRHFVIIDESAELASAGEQDKELKALKIECENIIKDLARRGRASGLRLLYCTQYPTAETVSSQVKRNLMTRICLPVDTSIASMVVLDEAGAEELPLIQGRAIYKWNRCRTMQAFYLDDELIQNTIKPYIYTKGDCGVVPHSTKEVRTGRTYFTEFEET